jgi:hypothetical protein
MTPANPRSRVRLRSGNAMPVLGIGTWQLTRDTPGAIVSALDLGYVSGRASNVRARAGLNFIS